MEKLAIFDIDYTLTKKETSIELYKYMLKRDKTLIKYIPAHILTGLGFGIKVFTAAQTKERFLKFLKGKKEEEIKQIVKDYYKNHLSELLYKDGLNAIKEFKSHGYKVYLISASPEFYVHEFYNIEGVDKVIGTRFKMDDGIFTPIVIGENCKGHEKVKRLYEELEKDKIEVDFKNSYMFSDSLSDLPLLELVGNGYLINYKKKSKFKILRWK